jgi:hypothetical protein
MTKSSMFLIFVVLIIVIVFQVFYLKKNDNYYYNQAINETITIKKLKIKQLKIKLKFKKDEKTTKNINEEINKEKNDIELLKKE